MSTDKNLTPCFRPNCYALHLGASYAQTILNSTLASTSASEGSLLYLKESFNVETLSEIDEALLHASKTHLIVDELHKKSVDEFIDKLLDERLEKVKS